MRTLKEDKLQTPEDTYSYSDTANVNDMLLHPNDAPDLPDEVQNAITRASIYTFVDPVRTPQAANQYLKQKKSKRTLTSKQLDDPIIIGDEDWDPDDSDLTPDISSRAEREQRRKQTIQTDVINNINQSLKEMDGPSDGSTASTFAHPANIQGIGEITAANAATNSFGKPSSIYISDRKKSRRKPRRRSRR
jgi:hypothetical protein